MRLLHARDLRFEEFFDELRPPYAILSHRWTAQEVSYKQYVDSTYPDGPGLDKIRNACTKTLELGLEWLWVDTICIDKSSSAELTEAINSMWNWYCWADICLAYLADVGRKTSGQDVIDEVSGSEWFQRGWTLQELLAPPQMIFYDARWRTIEFRNALSNQISEATGIHAGFITRKRPLEDASVAMKMSWASHRVTTRVEDQAYCLLGLFGVSMPLLYGERQNAFFRLQLEILRNSDDESIFAWRAKGQLRGMLADSPAEFASAGNIYKMSLGPEQRLPWAWTNKGLELRIVDRADKVNFDPMPAGNRYQEVSLGCYIKGPSNNAGDKSSNTLQRLHSEAATATADSYIAIVIRRYGNAWYRTQCNGFFLETGFVSMSRFMRAQLVYKYYYVPRHPDPEDWKEFEKEQ